MAIAIGDVTSNVAVSTSGSVYEVSGDGAFDKMMSTVAKHLKAQYDDDKIVGEAYATVYANSIIAVLAESNKFVLTVDEINAKALLMDKQLLELDKKIELINAQIAKMISDNLLVGAQISKMNAEEGLINANRDGVLAKTSRDNAEAAKKLASLDQTLINLEKQAVVLTEQAKAYSGDYWASIYRAETSFEASLYDTSGGTVPPTVNYPPAPF